MKLPDPYDPLGPSPGFFFGASMLLGVIIGMIIGVIATHNTCLDRTAEQVCCSYKGKHSKCLPCRPTRDVT